jgi:hypothetical protein
MNNYDGHFEGGEERCSETQSTVDFLLEWKEGEEFPAGEEQGDAAEQEAGEAKLEADPEGHQASGEESFMVSREAHTFIEPEETGQAPPQGGYDVSFRAETDPPGQGHPAHDDEIQGEGRPLPRNPWEALSGLVEKDGPQGGDKKTAPPSERKRPSLEERATPHSTGAPSAPAEIPAQRRTASSAAASERSLEENASFEWTAERHRAIEEALRETSEIKLPTVHNQLAGLRRGLQEGTLTKNRAIVLLAEVEQYLTGRLKDHKKMVTVAHEAIISARSDLLRGLQAYQESVNSLREYLATGEQVHLDLSIYTADQAASFVGLAKRTIFEVQPEAPAEERQEAKSLQGS